MREVMLGTDEPLESDLESLGIVWLSAGEASDVGFIE